MVLASRLNPQPFPQPMITLNQNQPPIPESQRDSSAQPRIDPTSRFGEDGSILGNNPPILSTLKGLRNHHNNHHFASKPRQNLHFAQQKASFWLPKSTPPNQLFRVSLTRHQPIAWTYTPKTIFSTSSPRRKHPSFRESCKTHCNNPCKKNRNTQRGTSSTIGREHQGVREAERVLVWGLQSLLTF